MDSLTESEKNTYFNPYQNAKAISIVQQDDGNWKGWMVKFGKVILVRGVGPGTVLDMLLTHDGKDV